MDTKAQAQKGFKTFMLTLVISLFVFSAIYVVLNKSVSGTDVSASAPAATVDTTSSNTTPEEPKESVFGELASKPVDTQPRAVLAAGDTTTTTGADGMASATSGTTTATPTSADTTPESTVPDTGVFGPTAGVILGTAIFGIVAYLLLLGPRRLALSSFEQKVLSDFENNKLA